jgi:hypothetical protein
MPHELGPGQEAEKAKYGAVGMAVMKALVVLWQAPEAGMLLTSSIEVASLTW